MSIVYLEDIRETVTRADKIRGLSTERIAEVLGTVPYVELVHRDNLALVE